ncbi:hypothetical protein [Desulfobacula toluolica]|uniref:Uncharacterized protein n=1 Tax=Desulfobacula toluolica (strain DSM 7467 / Tol2) TaxID=651182 RepID=K0NJX4_DESTT|nr:hypothetical protein [Desulfobacula toluolica]CCK80188.1 uncharacterized protein TOL2_C20270 [Desulfobacula toluolica Tol2]
MDTITEWINSNYTWIFSGIGVLIIGSIITFFKKKSSNVINRSQRSGNNSTNIQAGGNVEFTQKNDK